MPLKTCLGIKTDICDKNQYKSRNPYVAKFQKWPRMLCIDPLEGPRGLVSFANFLTPNGASRQVCMTSSVSVVFYSRFERIMTMTAAYLMDCTKTLEHLKQQK